MLSRLKSLIRQSLFHTGVTSCVRLLRHSRFDGCRALTFHRILPNDMADDYYARLMGEPTETELTELLGYLRRWFTFITPVELVDALRNRRRVDPNTLILTFDDGHVDIAARLVPLLDRLEIPATVFINTGAMDGEVLWFQKLFEAVVHSRLTHTPAGFGVASAPLRTMGDRTRAIASFAALHTRMPSDRWEELVPEICDAFLWNGELRDEQFMSWKDLLGVRRCRWITIGGHTVSHPYLPQCSDARLEAELLSCARDLRERLNLDFLPFSYPNGAVDARVTRAVEAAGYDCSFLMTPGLNRSGTDPFLLHRQYIAANVAKAAFEISFRAPLGTEGGICRADG